MSQYLIPLRPQQMRCPAKDLDHLLYLREREIIRWTFTPFGDQAGLDPLSDDEQAFSDIVHAYCGTKTRGLVPHVIAYLRTMEWSKPYLRSEFSMTCFGIGGAKVFMGRPVVPVHELEWLTTSDLLLVPHISAAGPNGIWHIERGEWHPFVLVAAKLKVWTLCGADGQPDFYYHLCKDDPVDFSSARGVDLFTSLAGAQEWLDESREDGDPVLNPMVLTARELLSCLARADVAAIDRMDYAVSHRGMVALGGTDTVASAHLLQALGASDPLNATYLERNLPN
jgi:hypothetical protein